MATCAIIEPVRRTIPKPPAPLARSRMFDVALLTLVVVAIYFVRLPDLTIRGEESRRARVACEMIETGDWIVPRQQHQIYLSRPPLGSWPIALLGIMRGEVDIVAVRLPTVMAVLLTTLLVYGYAQTFLTRTAALAAALGFATMGQVLEIGRLAETEGVFTMLVSGSLLVWHWGYLQAERRRDACTTTHGRRDACTTIAWYWIAGYALAALAGLAKGPQGPVYFAAPVLVYLWLRRDLRALATCGHLLGVGTFLLVLGAWQVPYYLRTDWQCCCGIWWNNAAERFAETSPMVLAEHMAKYPLEIFACTAPWSLWLLAYINPRFRAQLGTARTHAHFLGIVLAVTFPSVWFAAGAKTRYFMPLYPAAALLAAIVIERSVRSSVAFERNRWRHFMWFMAGVGACAAAVVALGTWGNVKALMPIGQQPAFADLFIVIAIAASFLLVALERSRSVQSIRASLLLVALLLGFTYAGPLLNAEVKSAVDTAAATAELQKILPPAAKLVSLNQVNHLFAYHWRQPIPARSWQSGDISELAPGEYFCFDERPGSPKRLPPECQRIATISLDRNQLPSSPQNTVVVCRVLPLDSGRVSQAGYTQTR